MMRVLGGDSPYVATSYNNISEVHRAQGKYQEALVQYHKSLEIRLRLFDQEHPEVVNSKYNIALLYETCNEMDKARELFLECEKIYSKVLGPGHSKTVEAALRASRCVEESV